MGAMQRAKEADLAKRQQQRGGSRYGSQVTGGEDTAWDIADCLDGTVQDTVSAVLKAGDLISFSKARAGYAVCITVLSGDEKYKFWCGDINECQRVLEMLTKSATEATASGSN